MEDIKSIYFHNPTPDGLEKCIVWLQKNGYHFISDCELFDILTIKKTIEKKLAFLSFDDAWKSNLDFIPIIEKYKVPITIFVPIEPLTSGNYWWDYARDDAPAFKELGYEEFLRRVDALKCKMSLKRTCMTVDDIKRLSYHPLVSLQAHTISHPILTKLPDDIVRREILESKTILEEIIGKEVRFFSYPNGSYGKRELEIVSNCFDMAFSIKMRHIKLTDNICELPRIGFTGDYYKDIIKYFGYWPLLKKILLFFQIIRFF